MPIHTRRPRKTIARRLLHAARDLVSLPLLVILAAMTSASVGADAASATFDAALCIDTTTVGGMATTCQAFAGGDAGKQVACCAALTAWNDAGCNCAILTGKTLLDDPAYSATSPCSPVSPPANAASPSRRPTRRRCASRRHRLRRRRRPRPRRRRPRSQWLTKPPSLLRTRREAPPDVSHRRSRRPSPPRSSPSCSWRREKEEREREAPRGAPESLDDQRDHPSCLFIQFHLYMPNKISRTTVFSWKLHSASVIGSRNVFFLGNAPPRRSPPGTRARAPSFPPR